MITRHKRTMQYLILALTLNIIFNPNNQMKRKRSPKNESEEIPISDLTNSVMIVIDSNSDANRVEVLFRGRHAIVVGRDSIPIELYVFPEFSEVELPLGIKKNLYEVTSVGFNGTFKRDNSGEIENFIIPTISLVNLKKMEFLSLRHADLDNLVDLKDIPIKELTLQNIRYSDGKKLIFALEQFKNLREVFYDQSLPMDIINSVNTSNLKFTAITNHLKGR